VAAEAGYQVIWGPPSSWYLSCYSDQCGPSGNGAGFEPWERIYEQEPYACPAASAHGCNTKGQDVNITDPEQQRRVIGGEVTVWGERLDPATMLATAFPRAAAAAERLWSPRAKDILAETAAARPRLEALRCVMLDRGLPVSTLDGGNSEASKWSLPSRPDGPGPNC
jgi:N-acetyl-beta-hexosaminidase